MIDTSLLFEIVVLLVLTAVALAAFERLRLPSIAGFLIVGALAGPGGVGVVSQPDHVSFLA
ncbi:MAG: cation:proton antiporter, partial [Deltaproteobacteria bacterium]|nr:cation:proton antiporter [Deltaproteobacteria bacterium]